MRGAKLATILVFVLGPLAARWVWRSLARRPRNYETFPHWKDFDFDFAPAYPMATAVKVGPLKHQRVEQRSSQGRAKPARQWRARSGRGHKYEKKLLSTYGKLCKPSIAPTKQGHCNILPVVPPLPLRKFLHLSDPCVWSPARPFRTGLPF